MIAGMRVVHGFRAQKGLKGVGMKVPVCRGEGLECAQAVYIAGLELKGPGPSPYRRNPQL